MAVNIVFIPMVILAVLLCIAVPVFLGVFVYQDAKARGMEPLLWAVIAVLAPSFIGLIIYLVARRDHVVLSCPNCGGQVQETFTSCPQCGQKLSANCHHCGAALRPEWKLCPQCGTEITEAEPFNSPVVNQGASSKKLLAVVVAILLIPVMLMVVAVGGYVGLSTVYDVEDEIFDNNLARDVFYELTDYTDYKVLTVSQSDLGEEAENWVEKCKAGKKGIYSQTFYKSKSSDYKGMQGSGTYDITYAYTVIVINDDVLYTDGGETSFEHYGDENFMTTENIRQGFAEVAGADELENAKRYNNVFVIRFPSSYDIDFTFTGGISTPMTAERKSESLAITLTNNTIVNGNNISMTYTIPFEGEYYSPIKQVKAETTITEQED